MTSSKGIIDEFRQELEELQRCFQAWAALPSLQRSGPSATELIEEALRAFFAKAAPPGVRTGKGLRPASNPKYLSDLDIVFDHENAAWLARVKLDVVGSPVLAHLDVGGRSSWDADKVREDLTRLQRTINDARGRGRKTWTGFVGVGAGFHSRAAEIMALAHEHHHDLDLAQWDAIGVGETWPFLDALIVPGMLLKKHDLFEDRDRDSNRWPVLYPFPVGDRFGLGDLWPLVAARRFLSSYLRKALGLEPWDAPSWQDDESDAILAGSARTEPWPDHWRVVALADNTPAIVYHWLGERSGPWQEHTLCDSPVCSAGATFELLPAPQIPQQILRKLEAAQRLLQHDKRPWSSLHDFADLDLADLVLQDDGESLATVLERFRSLGFRAEAHQRIVKHDGPAPRELQVTVSTDPRYPTADLDALRATLTPYLPAALRLAPRLRIPEIRPLLDRNFGGGAWQYAEEAVRVKVIDAIVIFEIPETNSGRTIRIAVIESVALDFAATREPS